MLATNWDSTLGIAGLLVNGIGLGFVAIQVARARRQAADAQVAAEAEVVRRKREATIDFYMTTVDQRSRWKSLLPDDWDTEAVHAFIAETHNPDSAAKRRSIIEYLGYFETMAVAVGGGVYDLSILDSLAGTRIRRIAANYRPYFEHVRAETGVEALYIELERFAEKLEEFRRSTPQYTLFEDRLPDHASGAGLAR